MNERFRILLALGVSLSDNPALLVHIHKLRTHPPGELPILTLLATTATGPIVVPIVPKLNVVLAGLGVILVHLDYEVAGEWRALGAVALVGLVLPLLGDALGGGQVQEDDQGDYVGVVGAVD